jgi:hypothetical protein
MKKTAELKNRATITAFLFSFLLLLLFIPVGASAAPPPLSSNVKVFAMGLNSPRGLTFGPDGYLYVAEAGTGGSLSTVGTCTQVKAPVGPYKGGYTAGIVKISPSGAVSNVVTGLPSDVGGTGQFSGVADVQFMGDKLYGLETGAGCSHGLAGTANTLFRVNSDGTITPIADLSSFMAANPIANPDPSDFEPDGSWYGFVAVHGVFYATEANSQQIVRISLGGEVTRVADLSTMFPPPAWQGDTAIAVQPNHWNSYRDDGNFDRFGIGQGPLYFATLGTFPVNPGTEGIWKLTTGVDHHDGKPDIDQVTSGLTAVLGLVIDDGTLYVLETTTVSGFPGPGWVGQGQVVCIGDHGSVNTVATGLSFPTAMTIGPDGMLYVSNKGFGTPPGTGQILQIDPSAIDCR